MGGSGVRIGVIADTHIPARAAVLSPQVLRALEGVNLILHAGDVTDPTLLKELHLIAPVMAVAGNNDPAESGLPLTQLVTVGGWRIGVTHGHEGSGKTTPDRALSLFSNVDCVVFGHSHIPCCRWQGGVLLFNPGSPTDRRRARRHSYGFLQVTEQGIAGEIIEFDRE